MTLVDTSVWTTISGAPPPPGADRVARSGDVVIHPFVRGEIALGHPGRRRAQVLRDLTLLPCVALVPDDDVLHMVEARQIGRAHV